MLWGLERGEQWAAQERASPAAAGCDRVSYPRMCSCSSSPGTAGMQGSVSILLLMIANLKCMICCCCCWLIWKQNEMRNESQSDLDIKSFSFSRKTLHFSVISKSFHWGLSAALKGRREVCPGLICQHCLSRANYDKQGILHRSDVQWCHSWLYTVSWAPSPKTYPPLKSRAFRDVFILFSLFCTWKTCPLRNASANRGIGKSFARKCLISHLIPLSFGWKTMISQTP